MHHVLFHATARRGRTVRPKTELKTGTKHANPVSVVAGSGIGGGGASLIIVNSIPSLKK